MPTTNELLYPRHIEHRRDQIDQALSKLGYDALLIHSGRPQNRLFDDQHPPFRANAPFVAMVPLPFAVDCLLEFRVGQRPRLWFCQAEDFWHQPPAEPAGWWADAFDLQIVASAGGWEDRFRNQRALAAIGEPSALSALGDGVAVNPAALVHALAEDRTVKTAWERECLHRANHVAARAHQVAARAFRDRKSELDIHLAYLSAAAQDQDELPYASIVALNEHAAVLHYQHRSAEPPQTSHSFLLDAGADQYGYASDITRTWVWPGNEEFAALVGEMEEVQQRLCEAMQPGVSFVDLHRQAHREVARLLSRAGLVQMDSDDLFGAGITNYFFPHGLGHFLGVQVHDINGQVDAAGDALPPPDEFPFLRLTRDLKPGNVVTVEPGLYFIPMLLERLRCSDYAQHVDWTTVDRLKPFGGIRIEDNVLVTESRPVNLTRQAFAELGE